MKKYLKEKLWITGILLSVVDYCDQWLFGRHDINAWFSVPGLSKNQSNFNGKFQLFYILSPQQSIKRNENQVIQSFSFKYCFITKTWSNQPFLASIGNPSEDNNRNFARGYPTEILFLFSPLRVIKVRQFKVFPSDFDLSHKPDQISRYWPP